MNIKIEKKMTASGDLNEVVFIPEDMTDAFLLGRASMGLIKYKIDFGTGNVSVDMNDLVQSLQPEFVSKGA